MKKIFYIILWAFLGLMLSFIAHAAVEINYLKSGPANIQWSLAGACALPLWLLYLLPILGLALGLCLGFFFWQKVYVERGLK